RLRAHEQRLRNLAIRPAGGGQLGHLLLGRREIGGGTSSDRNPAELRLRTGRPERRAQVVEDRAGALERLLRSPPLAAPAAHLPAGAPRPPQGARDRWPVVLQQRLVESGGRRVEFVPRGREQGAAGGGDRADGCAVASSRPLFEEVENRLSPVEVAELDQRLRAVCVRPDR